MVPLELAAGPRMSTWCSETDWAALQRLPQDHPERAALVWRAQHEAFRAFNRARDEWLVDHGQTLHSLRSRGLLGFRHPY